MSNWKLSPSRTALGVAVTAAALATSLGAYAAPIQPENDDALFKLRYASNAKASSAARDAINRAILPLIDASAVDEYTLEPVATMPMETMAVETFGPTVSGSITTPIVQTAPQIVTCPTPAPVAQPTTTVINITPPAQQVAPVFAAAPQQVAEVAPAFFGGGFGGGFIGGGFGGGSVSSNQTVVVEGGGDTFIDQRSFVDNADNRVFNDNSDRRVQ